MSRVLTVAEHDVLKLRKFRALVRHANARAPYYADIIRARGIDVATCTPADFPVLTKSLLMANFDGIVTDKPGLGVTVRDAWVQGRLTANS